MSSIMLEYLHILREKSIVEDFILNGTEAGVAAVIQGIKKDDKFISDIDRVSDALYLAFSNDNFDRVVSLLVAVKGRCEVENARIDDDEKFSELSKAVDYMLTMDIR